MTFDTSMLTLLILEGQFFLRVELFVHEKVTWVEFRTLRSSLDSIFRELREAKELISRTRGSKFYNLWWSNCFVMGRLRSYVSNA